MAASACFSTDTWRGLACELSIDPQPTQRAHRAAHGKRSEPYTCRHSEVVPLRRQRAQCLPELGDTIPLAKAIELGAVEIAAVLDQLKGVRDHRKDRRSFGRNAGGRE
jgi:hypothetical protein